MYTANINVRTDATVKEKAQALLAAMGLDMTTAINMFLNQLVIRNTMPFIITGPTVPLPTMKKCQAGGWEGDVWMSDDFDAPLDDFKEYME